MTGLTSFAGLALAARLATEGNDVHAIVRPSTDTSRMATLSVISNSNRCGARPDDASALKTVWTRLLSLPN